MAEAAHITPRIVETLYCEALVLSDEVQAAFGPVALWDKGSGNDRARIARAGEGLRTTTRMMQAMAWLLNHRAYFKGEISRFQLVRYGRMARDRNPSVDADRAILPDELAELVDLSEEFYARLVRLDLAWNHDIPASMSAVAALRENLEHRLVS